MNDTSHGIDADAPVDGWRRLPPEARSVGMIAAALGGLALGAFSGIPLGVLALGWFSLGLPVLLALLFVLAARARWRHTTWRLDERGLQVRSGVVWRKECLVPRSRVQHLDLERGPIERRFGLATLVVHTAGTRLQALRQSGFREEDAVALRDALLPEADRHDDDL